MIKNIVLDWGGILIDLNGKACIDAFEHIGAHEVALYVENHLVDDLFLKQELGLISVEEFCQEARAISPNITGSDEDICMAWNVLLQGIPAHRLERLSSLKKRFRLYLLSNTNELHWEYAKRFWEPEHYFDRIFLSNEMHLKKPDREIFLRMMEDAGLRADETLFLDDSAANCETAAAIGINSVNVKSIDDWEGI